jgi:hypothetical protein
MENIENKQYICQYCSLIFKNSSNLKQHITGSKKCLKSRGVKIESKYTCKGCEGVFMTKINFTVHQQSCKEYFILKYKEENEELQRNNTFNNNRIMELLDKLDNSDKLCSDLQEKQSLSDNLIKDLQTRLEKTTVDHDNYLTLKVRYEELEKQHDKTITKLELKISQCDAFIQTLAREGSNKVTTTNNTVNNTIRNHLSSTYTVEGLEPKQLEDTMRQHYTESDFFGGQKRLADFWVDHVIKTPDNKMMVCCTDVSRKKFKILDIQGNLKEDIEARLLCKKLKVPVKMVTKEIYDTVIERIEAERDRLSSDDRSRREKLLDDSMRAQQMYMDNLNFDDLNYNQDFMHELCVLLNV